MFQQGRAFALAERIFGKGREQVGVGMNSGLLACLQAIAHDFGKLLHGYIPTHKLLK
jgi:hypothetical protein